MTRGNRLARGRTLTLGLARGLFQLLFLLLLLSHDFGVTLFALLVCQSVVLLGLLVALLLHVSLSGQFALISSSHSAGRKLSRWLLRKVEKDGSLGCDSFFFQCTAAQLAAALVFAVLLLVLTKVLRLVLWRK